MTIKKYTFFSPNGNDFPVTANSDAKLYMALGNLDYTTFSRVDWSNTTQVGLTKTFVKTSFVVAGRFFQAENELVQLLPAATNFIHAVIDLSTPLDPVKFTSETTDNSNTIDINNSSGIYKRCIEKIVTNSGSIISTEKIAQNRIFDIATIKKAVINTANVVNSNVSGATNLNTLNTSGKAVLSILEVKNSTLLKNTTISGNLTVSGVTTSRYFTATESVTANNVIAKNNTTTNTLTVKNSTSLKNTTIGGNLTVSDVATSHNVIANNNTTTNTLTVKNSALLKNTTISGNLTVSGVILKNTTIAGNLTVNGVTTSNFLTATESVTSKNVTSKNVTSNNVIAENVITSKNVIAENTLIVKAVKGKRSEQFQTPTTYATITGTALEFFTLYKSANVVTCNFWGTPTSGSIPGGGAIVGWITDNAFKPEYTQNFTVFTANGQRCRFTVDPGGAIRSHEPVGKNVEIWDSMQWIVAGTEGGQASK